MKKNKINIYEKGGGMVSTMGYRDNSPFRNSNSLSIYSPQGYIDMGTKGNTDSVSQPLIANGQILEPNSGINQVPPDKYGYVKETPMMSKYGGNIYKSGGSVPIIPMYYEDSGTPIYRDTTDAPPNVYQTGTNIFFGEEKDLDKKTDFFTPYISDRVQEEKRPGSIISNNPLQKREKEKEKEKTIGKEDPYFDPSFNAPSESAFVNNPYSNFIKGNTSNTVLTDFAKQQRDKVQYVNENMRGINVLLGDDIDNYYTKEGNLDVDLLSNIPDLQSKVNNALYQEAVEEEEENYDNTGVGYKVANAVTAFASDPIVTGGRFLDGKRPLYQQAKGLRGGEENIDPLFYNAETGANKGYLNTAINLINPVNYTANALSADNLFDTAMEGATAVSLGSLGLTNAGVSGANLVNRSVKGATPYLTNLGKGVTQVVKGNASPSDLFKKQYLSRFSNTDDVVAMRNRIAEGTAGPTTGQWFNDLSHEQTMQYLKQFGDDALGATTTTTKAAAKEFNLSSLAKKLNNKNLPISERTRIETALKKSVPSPTQVANNPELKSFYNSQSKTMQKNIDKVLDNPEGYWKMDIWKNNPKLQKVIGDKSFFNTDEFLMKAAEKINYVPTSVGEVNALLAAKTITSAEAKLFKKEIQTLAKKSGDKATVLLEEEDVNNNIRYAQN